MSKRYMLERHLDSYFHVEDAAHDFYPEVYESLAFQEQMKLYNSAKEAMILLLKNHVGDE